MKRLGLYVKGWWKNVPAKRKRVKLGLELLEDRLAPAIITWDGGGDGVNWADAKNWSADTLPGTSDDAVIAANVQVLHASGATVVKSVNCAGGLIVGGDSFEVTEGNSLVSGALTLMAGVSLTARGSGVTFEAQGTTSIDGASLSALGGGRLSLPGLTAYAMVRGGTATLGADGAGSILDLSAVTTLTGSSASGSDSVTHTLEVRATGGGVVDLSNAAQIIDPAVGGATNRRFVVSAAGAGSLIDLSGLTELRDTTNASNFGIGVSLVEATGGGEVRVPLLTSLANTGLSIDGASSVVPIGQLTSVTGGSISVSGAGNDRAFAGLTDITGSDVTANGATITLAAVTQADAASFHASGGGRLSLPALTAYAMVRGGTATLGADGAGSILDLSAVTTLTGSSASGSDSVTHTLEVRATGGGVVDLSNAAQIIDPAVGGATNRRFVVSAAGAGSLIDLSGLTELRDTTNASNFGIGVSLVEATGGGEVRVPLLTGLANTGLSIDGASSVVPIGQLTSVTGGSISVSGAGNDRAFAGLTSVAGSDVTANGATITLAAVTQADAASLYAKGGGLLSLPGLTAYAMVRGGTATLGADGAGSVLDLSAVTTLTGSSASGSDSVTHTLEVRATGGGKVDLSNATQIIDPAVGGATNRRFVVSAAGAGSLIDLSGLTELRDTTNASYFGIGTSLVEASGGGEVRVPLLTGLANTGLSIDGASSVVPIGQLTSVTGGSITVSGAGNDRAFAGLTDITGSDITSKGGGLLSLPGLTAYAMVRGGTATLGADGEGSVLDLSAVAALAGSSADGTDNGGHTLEVLATNGGKIDLSNATRIVDPAEGNAGGRRFVVRASGSGSLIDLSRLAELRDTTNASTYYGIGLSSVEASGGGEVRVPLLTSLANTGLVIDGASSVVPIDQLTSVTGGSITVSGGSRSFTGLTDISGTSLVATNAATISIPGVTKFDGPTLQTSDGGKLDLPALTSLTMSAGSADLSGFTLDALTMSGGELLGDGTLTVRDTFDWTGGTLRGTGKLVIAEGAVGTITDSADKRLGKTIENAGRLTYSGSGLRFGPNGEVGTITNLPGKTFTLIGDGDIGVASANAGHAVNNQGSLVRYGAGDSRIDVPVLNTGSVLVQQGKLDLNGGGLTLPGTSFLNVLAGTDLRVTGAVAGSTTNTDLFSAPGALTLSGGTLPAPLTLEAMGVDRGAVAGGYVRNFALGTVRLDAAYVKLVNSADNAAGAGAEAVYVDTLIVAAGSTLDLNGLKLYARSVQILGTVIGGVVTIVPDGGSLSLNAPTFGSISAAGEADDWGFYGRAGQRISVTVNPGDGGSPSPAAPVLGFAEVQLVSSSGEVLASASNAVAGNPVSLTLESLPSDGNYVIRVKAPAAHPNSTGNYLLAGYDATIDTAPLVLNQQVIGLLENTRSTDRWMFSGSANQQVRLDFVNASFPGVRFALTGPNGWAGFIDLAGDSDLVTLPSDGSYQIEATTNGAGYGSYAFSLEQISQTTLALGVPYSGTFTGAGFAQLFSVNVASGTPLNVVLDSPAAAGAEVYLKLGSPPTRRSFDYQSGSFGDTQSVLAPFAAPGAWYILVYAGTDHAGTPFTLRADATAVFVTDVTPAAGATNQASTVTVRGAGFLPGSTVELVSAGGASTSAQTVGLDSTTQITAAFDLSGLAAGSYGVRVTLADGATAMKAGAFQVLPAGQAHLETRLIMPPALGRHAVGTLYVEYANTGTAAMAAPILTLQSADPDGSDRPFLTLDSTGLVEGFYSGVVSSSLPEGFSHSVQIYATGAIAGILQPGERFQVPVYYAGLQTPWDFTDTAVEMEVLVSSAGDSTPIDWGSMQQSLRPSWISAEAWPAVYANLQTQIGSTWGDYIRMLNENAAYLGRLGEHVIDVSELYNFELQQALGYSPVGTIASATDAAVATPGLSLDFGRSYATTLAQRYEVGAFGRGWVVPWQTSLFTENGGIVVISDAAGSQRRFEPDGRRPGRFFGGEGETGTLRQLSGGAYELTESTGQIVHFRPNGTMEYVQDVNGNRITTTYASGRLTKLTHSSGATLTLAYNTAGRITSITDSAGRVTTYGYDATNNYLLTVTTVAGTTTYAYNTTGPITKLHTLASVSDATGVTQTYEYDSEGRLSGTHTGTNVNSLTFSYDSAGTITTTDAAGGLFQVFMDHRGLAVRQASGTGYYVNYTYDQDRMLTKTTDALGRTESYTYTVGGALTSTTDALGHTTKFLPGGPNERPSTFIDANGNTTRYAYDAVGNLTGTTYADGSVERVSYDAQGNAIQLVNRRGQSIARTFNAAGQLTGETFPDGTSNMYTYDARGRLTTAVDPNGTTTFTYDPFDRITRVDYPQGRWLAYQYDTAGRRTRMEDESGFVTRYVYDAVGRLGELRDAADTLVVRYTYDAAGRLAREDKGNGTYTITTYDADSRVTSIFNYAPNGDINSKFIYTYDLLDRRTGMTTIDGGWTYAYDLTGQLKRAVFVSTNPAIANQDLNYVYDALGNRIRTVLNGVTTEYTTNDLNQYVTVGSTTMEYDRDGSLIAEVGPDGTRTYTYDSQNRLVKVVTPQGTTEYSYDALGNRTVMVANGVETQYEWDPFGLDNVTAEYDSTGNRTVTYIHGSGLEAMRTATLQGFYDFDAIGSTAAITDASGLQVNQYAYDPFGAGILLNESVLNSFKYVGELGVLEDKNGLQFMRQRYLLSSVGKFSSQDPIRLSGGDANLSRYVANDPVNYVDPDGFGRFCRTPVSGWPGNIGVTHEQYFYDDGNNIGATGNPGGYAGLGGDNRGQSAYDCYGPSFDDARIHDAVEHVDPGEYNMLFNNCHDYAQKIRDYYETPHHTPGGDLDYPPGGPLEPDKRFPPAHVDPVHPPGKKGPGSSTAVGTPVDPNEKLGAVGSGPQAFIADDITIPYRINFENLGPGSLPTPTQPATAPAQQVVVTDQLSAMLDWNTFQFTEFGFGDTVVSILSGQKLAFQRVPLTFDGKSFTVEVELSFDITTGLVRVVFQSVDPTTQLPPDVLTGFLPPEDGTGRGKGHFAYSVRPKAGLPTGTEIRNVARIVFDGQTAIATNQVNPHDPAAGTDPHKEALNTIDAGTPSSSVINLPAITSSANFTVRWGGADDAGGSGIASYDVYVSVDGGPWEVWRQATKRTQDNFAGQDGHAYAFFSVAVDHVGLREATPTAAQAQTIVSVPPFTPTPPTDGSIPTGPTTPVVTPTAFAGLFVGPPPIVFATNRSPSQETPHPSDEEPASFEQPIGGIFVVHLAPPSYNPFVPSDSRDDPPAQEDGGERPQLLPPPKIEPESLPAAGVIERFVPRPPSFAPITGSSELADAVFTDFRWPAVGDLANDLPGEFSERSSGAMLPIPAALTLVAWSLVSERSPEAGGRTSAMARRKAKSDDLRDGPEL